MSFLESLRGVPEILLLNVSVSTKAIMTSYFKYYLIFLGMYFCAMPSLAQYYCIDRINLPAQLDNRSVHSITMDELGRLWFGMQSGVAIWDGNQVSLIEQLSVDGKVKSIGKVNALLHRENNKIVLGASNGIFQIDITTGEVSSFQWESPRSSMCLCLFERMNGDLCVGSEDGLLILNKELNLRYKLTTQDGLKSNIIRAIYEDSDHILWLGTFDCLHSWNEADKILAHYVYSGFQDRNQLILSIQSQTSNRDTLMYIGTENGIHIFNRNQNRYVNHTESFLKKEPDIGVAKSLCFYEDSLMIVGSDNGLYLLEENGVVQRLKHEYKNNNSIAHNVINTVYTNQTEWAWIGTDNGLCRINLGDRGVLFNQIKSHGDTLLSVFHINKFSHLDNELWMSTLDGIRFYDIDRDKFIELNKDKLSHSKIVDVIKNNDLYWIATPGGITIYYKSKDHYEQYRHLELEDGMYKGGYIASIYLDSKKNIWIGTYRDGLFLCEDDKEYPLKFKNVTHDLLSLGKGISVTINDMLEMGDGTMWFSTNMGIISYNPSNSNIEYLKHNEQNIQCDQILKDNENLWIRIRDHILCYSTTRKRFILSKVLPIKSIGFSVDRDHIFVVSSNRVYQYDKNLEFISDLSPVTTEKFTSAIQSFNESVLVGSQYGFFSIPISNDVDKIRLKRPIITKLLINGIDVSHDQSTTNPLLKDTEAIDVQYSNNSFTFVLGHLMTEFTHPIKYEYYLEGYSSRWECLPQESNRLALTQIPPGKYRLNIRTIGKNGHTTSPILKVEIKVNNPWWLSGVAKAGYLVLLLCILLSVYVLIKRKIKKLDELSFLRLQREKNEEILKYKNRIFTNISHELRTPLTLILTPIEYLMSIERSAEHIKYYLMIQRNARCLLSIVNQLLDAQKLEFKEEKIRLNGYDIIKFIVSVTELFQNEAKLRGIQFSVKTSVEHLFMFFDHEKVDRICFNLLSNAFKYTKDGGVVSLEIFASKEKITIVIKDNGCGISDDILPYIFDRFTHVKEDSQECHSGIGVGLSIVKEYIDIMGGEIECVSKVGIGSKFTVNIRRVLTSPNGEKEIPLIDDSIKRSDKPNLLIISEEEDLQEFLSDVFRVDYHVITIHDQNGFYEIAKQIQPILIVLNLTMDDRKGINLCKMIKSDHCLAHIPIVILSTKSDDESEFESYLAGADHYISKPFKMDSLLYRVKNMISQQSRIKQLVSNEIVKQRTEIIQSGDTENKIFLDQLVSHIYDNIENCDLTIGMLADLMNMSHATLYRRVKELSGLTVAEFVRSVRIKKAGTLLKKKELSIGEVMYKSGFNNRSYFNKSFKDVYGTTPKAYKISE